MTQSRYREESTSTHTHAFLLAAVLADQCGVTKCLLMTAAPLRISHMRFLEGSIVASGPLCDAYLVIVVRLPKGMRGGLRHSGGVNLQQQYSEIIVRDTRL